MSWWRIPFTGPRASPLKKLILTFANSLNLDQADIKRSGLICIWTASGLMMFLGEFFKNYFLCKQFEPDQARHNNVRPRSASTPCADPNGGGGGGGKGVRRTPSRIYKKNSFFSNWSGPLKNHKATFLCMTNIRTLAKRNLNGVSLAGRWWPAYSSISILSPLIK